MRRAWYSVKLPENGIRTEGGYHQNFQEDVVGRPIQTNHKLCLQILMMKKEK